ncbi:membrane protein [Streptomyces sp. MUSC 125]|nr:membrane protein [Streptomyces sp. MUSC 125]
MRARVAALEGERARPPRHRVTSFLAAVLIVLGCVLAPLAVVAAWAADQVDDTDRYVATVAPLASNPDVQDAVANRITDAVMTHLDLPTLLSEAAPQDRPRLEKALGGRLGDALESAVRSFVHSAAQTVVRSNAFKTVWTEANRKIHSALDKALTGSGGGAVQLTNDTVNLDIGPLVDQLKQRLVDSGITVAGNIPTVHTNFTLVRSDQIGKIKTYVRLLQLAGNWLPVLAVLLVAGGVLLSVHRRRALVAGSLGVVVATGILGIGLRVFRVIYLDRLPADVSQAAAGAVYDTLTRFLQTTVRMVVALGIIVALAAWLTGPGRRAGLVRRLWTSGIGAVRGTADRAGMRTGPVGPFVSRYRTWITWVLVAAVLLVYLLWSYPTGWVVVGLALCLLFLLAVVEFLAEPPAGKPPATGTPA